MSRISDLYALQEIDVDLGERRAALEQVEVQLGESEELATRRAELASNRARLAELEPEQRDMELQVREQRDHIGGVEGRLYGGTVGNPRELVALQDDVEQRKAILGQREDRLLQVLTEVDELQGTVRSQAEALERDEREWQERQEHLTREQANLTAAVAALSARRAAAAALVDPRDLNLYQTIAHMTQGRAVARAERGMCLACRINQPLSVMQRARGGQELVQCTSCQRILHAG